MFMKRKLIRKLHRYLGLIIGIQFIFWTISGLYFSWTNLDNIHGDHFRVIDYEADFYSGLIPTDSLDIPNGINSIEMREIGNTPYYWINNEALYNAHKGTLKDGITEDDALLIAQKHIKSSYIIKSVELIHETDNHHEYRGRTLPAYVISYDDKNRLKAYVSKLDGKFQTVRHRAWRWFDFLWMIHTMDYRTRDNFNTFLLRAFSLFGLFTVISGFTLWTVTSVSIKRLRKQAD
jgi:uncharacterized iron-regulated membrane protein